MKGKLFGIRSMFSANAWIGATLFFFFIPAFAQFLPPQPIDEKLTISLMESQRYQSLQQTQLDVPADSNIDITYYKLDLSIQAAPGYLQGKVTIKAKSLTNNLNSITLDLMRTLTIDSIKMESARVLFVQY